VLTLVLAFSAAALQAADRYIVRNGEPNARIRLPRVIGKATLLAAHELSDYIEKISGARIPVDYYRSGEPPYAETGQVKIVLRPELDPKRPASADGTEDVFTIEARDDVLTIRGNSDTAVLYGAYQYLNDLGVRWFMPGELGENVPRLEDLKLAEFAKTYKPSFRTRIVAYSGPSEWHFDAADLHRHTREYELWLLRNKLHFSASRFHEGRAKYVRHFDMNWLRERFHGTIKWVLAGVDFDQTPERFALTTMDGETKRRGPHEKGPRRGQICFTHPANIQGTVQLALKYFSDYPERLTYPLSLADHAGVCECENCVKANRGAFPPAAPDRLVWGFMNAVAAGVRAREPHKNICFHACYGAMTEPPDDTRANPGVMTTTARTWGNQTHIADPDCPYNRLYRRRIGKIAATGAQMGAYEYLLVAGVPQPLAILDSLKTYHQLGYRLYYAEQMGRDEQRKILRWVMAQLLWDGARDPAELLGTFCREFYGDAGDAVLEVLRLVDERIRRKPMINFGSFCDIRFAMTPDLVDQGRAALRRARRRVAGRERKRLQRFADTFEMWARYARLVDAAYTALDRRTQEAKSEALRQIDRFEAFWKKRDLAETCSPVILEDHTYAGARTMRRVVNRMSDQVRPARSKRLRNADRALLIEEAFGIVPMPKDADAVFLLPELWRFKLDLDRTGVEQGWARPDFDDSAWVELSTYGLYRAQGFPIYDDKFWYRVRFQAPEFPDAKRLSICIGGIDKNCDVYVNGARVHRHLYMRPADAMGFEFDVTDAIRRGRPNVIAIAGDNGFFAGLHKPCALYARETKAAE